MLKANAALAPRPFVETRYNRFRDPQIGIGGEKNIHVQGKHHFCTDGRYQIEKVLGKGSFGVVCVALDLKSTSLGFENRVAIKKVFDIFSSTVMLKRAIRELKLMRHFKGHRNVNLEINFMAPYQGLYCIQELLDLDLSRVIYSGIQFSDFHVQSFIYQILCGLKYIHSADVIHRDIKPGNILVSSQGVLKICDFGLARGMNEQYFGPNNHAITGYVATRWYRAPELMFSKRMYNESIDLWAVGCILAELFGRRPIFCAKNPYDQIERMIRVLGTPDRNVVYRLNWKLFQDTRIHYPAGNWKSLYPFASNHALNLLDNLIQWDPLNRISTTRALEHPYLSKVRNADKEATCKTFDFSFEDIYTSAKELKKLLELEVLEFKKERGIVPS
ncbi:kinase-like domain-containing protein [Scheffersomyces amazonensis]|uniref:kinase-like domain-containing protein n=1 Tax=Scheffersomyces amazonensis TaxID=1078765 RepID=UPI00315D04E2